MIKYKKLIDKGTNKKLRELLLTAQFIMWRERCSRISTDVSKNEDLEEKEQMADVLDE